MVLATAGSIVVTTPSPKPPAGALDSARTAIWQRECDCCAEHASADEEDQQHLPPWL